MQKPYFFSRDSLTDEKYRLIGLIAAEWAEFEVSMETAILHFLYGSWGSRSWRRSHVLSTEMGNVARVNAIMALAVIDHEDGKLTTQQIATLQKLCHRADEMRGKRNDSVHSTWVPAMGIFPEQRMKMSAKRVLKVSVEDRTEADLKIIAEDIAKLHWDWREFFAGLRSRAF